MVTIDTCASSILDQKKMRRSRKRLLIIGGGLLLLVIVAFTPPGVETHTDSRTITAPKEVVWQVISDVSNYHRYATGLDNVTVMSGSGVGMVRACSDEQGAWQETCTFWDEGNAYSFDVDPGTGFPYPFTKMNGTWSAEAMSENVTELVVTFEYRFPYRWMHWLFNGATHDSFDEGDKTLLDNWEEKILATEVSAQSISDNDSKAK